MLVAKPLPVYFADFLFSVDLYSLFYVMWYSSYKVCKCIPAISIWFDVEYRAERRMISCRDMHFWSHKYVVCYMDPLIFCYTVQPIHLKFLAIHKLDHASFYESNE